MTYDATLQTLLAYPVPELATLRRPAPLAQLATAISLPPGGTLHTLVGGGATSADIELEFVVGTAATSTITVVVANMPGVKGTTITVVVNPHVAAAVPAVPPAAAPAAAASTVNVSVAFPGCHGTFLVPTTPAANSLTLDIRVLVDVAVVEVFVAGGRGVCSAAMPSVPAGPFAGGVSVGGSSSSASSHRGHGQGSVKLTNATVWAMSSIPAHNLSAV